MKTRTAWPDAITNAQPSETVSLGSSSNWYSDRYDANSAFRYMERSTKTTRHDQPAIFSSGAATFLNLKPIPRKIADRIFTAAILIATPYPASKPAVLEKKKALAVVSKRKHSPIMAKCQTWLSG